MIGLLAATGMRVGEAIAPVQSDIDWVDGVAIVRASKFNKSRELPLAPTTVDALAAYAALRRSARAGAVGADLLCLPQRHGGDLRRLLGRSSASWCAPLVS